jgi:hypothetical protein
MTANEIAKKSYEINRAYHPPVIETPGWEFATDLVRAYTIARVEFLLGGGYWPEFPTKEWERVGIRSQLGHKEQMESDYAFNMTVKQLASPRTEIG